MMIIPCVRWNCARRPAPPTWLGGSKGVCQLTDIFVIRATVFLYILYHVVHTQLESLLNASGLPYCTRLDPALLFEIIQFQ